MQGDAEQRRRSWQDARGRPRGDVAVGSVSGTRSAALVRERIRRQKNPARDAELTRSFHRMLSRLNPPPKPIDGVKLSHPIDWPGWQMVQVDVMFLK